MYTARLFTHGLLKKLAGIFIFCLAFSPAWTQIIDPNGIVLDLGDLEGTEKTPATTPAFDRKVETIYLKNAFPKRNYIIAVDVTFRLIPLPTMTSTTVPAVRSNPACEPLQKKYEEVYNWVTDENAAKTEKELKQKLTELATLQGNTRCTDPALLNNIAALFNDCTRAYPLPAPLQMQATNDYTITITTGDRTFKYLFQGKDRGQWVLNYGFLFSSRALEPSRFYTEQLGADSFQIRKKQTPNVLDLRFAPTVFFTWFPNKKLADTWNGSLSLGLGFNMQSPVVSLGYNLMYNQNIGFSTGVVFYEQQKLNGRYQESQIVKTNLEESQLYESSFFRPNLFLALNVRLGQNPFHQTQ